jgi:hypothetical protein
MFSISVGIICTVSGSNCWTWARCFLRRMIVKITVAVGIASSISARNRNSGTAEFDDIAISCELFCSILLVCSVSSLNERMFDGLIKRFV